MLNTLQLLHFHTKLASPRLPDKSLDSWLSSQCHHVSLKSNQKPRNRKCRTTTNCSPLVFLFLSPLLSYIKKREKERNSSDSTTPKLQKKTPQRKSNCPSFIKENETNKTRNQQNNKMKKAKRTKRLKFTQLGCVSRHDVHCTLKV